MIKSELIDSTFKDRISEFLNKLGINNYSFVDNKLTIPIGWKGKYKKPEIYNWPDEEHIIDYIERWG